MSTSGPLDASLRVDLDQLRKDAADVGVSVTNVLRRAKIVAARAGDSEMIVWLDRELAGYPDGKQGGCTPPNWRRVRGLIRGFNPYHGWQPIDFGGWPEIETLEWMLVGHAVAEVEKLAVGKGDAQRPLDALARFVGVKVALIIPRTQFVTILEHIRTQVIDWTIGLESRGFTPVKASDNPMEQQMPQQPTVDPRKVFIIHGRNTAAAREMQRFLSALDLSPVDFDELRARMGGTPTVADIVTAGMDECQAVIALFTGDEWSALRPDLRTPHDAGKQVERWQARPNVIFEAGMAFGRDRQRVVFVLLGQVELFTDVEGIHVLRPTNDAGGARHTLRLLLKNAGCPISESTRWMSEGDFEGVATVPESALPADPFKTA